MYNSEIHFREGAERRYSCIQSWIHSESNSGIKSRLNWPHHKSLSRGSLSSFRYSCESSARKCLLSRWRIPKMYYPPNSSNSPQDTNSAIFQNNLSRHNRQSVYLIRKCAVSSSYCPHSGIEPLQFHRPWGAEMRRFPTQRIHSVCGAPRFIPL